MQFCPTCAAEVGPSIQFCRSCGADLRLVRTAIQTPSAATLTDPERLEISRAIAAKIASLNPDDPQFIQKMAFLRTEGKLLLDQPFEDRRGTVTTSIAFLGGMLLFLEVGIVSQFIWRNESFGVNVSLALIFATLLVTVGGLLAVNYLPGFRKKTRQTPMAEVPVARPAGVRSSSQAAEGFEPVTIPKLPPPSVTENTTEKLRVEREFEPVNKNV